jgi:hypothetical protein
VAGFCGDDGKVLLIIRLFLKMIVTALANAPGFAAGADDGDPFTKRDALADARDRRVHALLKFFDPAAIAAPRAKQ